MKQISSTVQSNIIGTAAGATAGWYFGKKYISNPWALFGVIVVSGIAGALVQKTVMAKISHPTKTDAK